MSTQNAKTINQKEYLKKYLSGDKEKKKKNKKHKKTTHAKVKIIDDDAHDSNNEEIDEDLLLGGEDAPQIVGEYIEENPNAVRSKWRNIAVKEPKTESDTETNGNDGHVNENPAEDESFLWGKASTIKIKKELSPSGRPHDIHSPAIQIKHEKRSSSSDRTPAAIRIKQEKRSSSRDQSPERIRRKSKERSLQRKRRDSDQSPPRKRLDSYPITLRKSRNSDQSPLRRRREKDPSPPRKQRYSDQSPPRRRRETDQSPPRRQRDSDQSPPRRRRDGDLSPCRRRQSPPRRRPSLEQSPPRRRHSSTRDRRQPTYPRRQHSPDQSPPRRIKKEERGSPSPPYERKSRWSKEKRCRTPSPPPTHKPKTKHTLDGKKAGLQDAQSLKIETDMRRREEHKMFDQMSSEVSGRDAEVRVRSTGRRGRRARDAAAEDPEEQKRKEAHELKKKELYDRWGKGLKQLEDQHARHAEMTHEAAKPVARYANDEDLDRHLREQEHADDPMLKYMQEKRRKLELKSDKPVMPVYSGSYPENRFGIRPGYRWDGVDRSNGYEQRWFNKQNERRAVQDEAYKYSVEDM